MPERQLPRLPWGWGNQHTIVGDVLDPPTGGAEREHVTYARLVHHLFIEFTDARRLFSDHEDPEQAAVWNRPARGHREALGTWSLRERVLNSVPDESRPQLREPFGWVLACQHVKDGVER